MSTASCRAASRFAWTPYCTVWRAGRTSVEPSRFGTDWQAVTAFAPATIAGQFFIRGDAVMIEKTGHRDGFYEG